MKLAVELAGVDFARNRVEGLALKPAFSGDSRDTESGFQLVAQIFYR